MKLLLSLFISNMALFVFTSCDAQIQNAKTDTVKIYGNCGKCEKAIENAAYKKGEARADWDKDTKMAQIVYDTSITNIDAVLQRIAAAGYDSDKFNATEDAYAHLPSCCQYERPKKSESPAATPAVVNPVTENPVVETPAGTPDPTPESAPKMVEKQAASKPSAVRSNPLTDVYAAYFALKDALVATDGAAAATQAKILFKAIDNVRMESLPADQHIVWMKYRQKLSYDAEHIKGVTDTEHQREYFASLSNNMYEVMKVIKADTPVYFDHCPMYNDGKGADWLSKEKGIKNPYYGKSMLTCGKVTETLE